MVQCSNCSAPLRTISKYPYRRMTMFQNTLNTTLTAAQAKSLESAQTIATLTVQSVEAIAAINPLRRKTWTYSITSTGFHWPSSWCFPTAPY